MTQTQRARWLADDLEDYGAQVTSADILDLLASRGWKLADDEEGEVAHAYALVVTKRP